MAHLRYKNISSELRSLLLRLQEETEKAGRSEDEREENQGGEKQRASLGPESESAAPDTAPDRAAPEAAPGNAPEAPPEPSADAAPPSAEELTKRAATLRKHIRRCNVRLRAAMEALRGMLDDVTMFQAPQLLLLSQS
ncbi:hypothetical protein CLOM_g3455 [Closterium sp. NIES-68]|nr:hypothetical protein CLOM_g3455 [Closterium sp. NIES-68]